MCRNECRFPEFYEADVRVTNGHALEIAMPAIRGNEAAIQHHVASVFPKHAVHCSQGKLSIKGRFDGMGSLLLTMSYRCRGPRKCLQLPSSDLDGPTASCFAR
jgi:hypothetical protein